MDKLWQETHVTLLHLPSSTLPLPTSVNLPSAQQWYTLTQCAGNLTNTILEGARPAEGGMSAEDRLAISQAKVDNALAALSAAEALGDAQVMYNSFDAIYETTDL